MSARSACLAACLAVRLSVASTGAAQAPTEAVAIELNGLFGDELLTENAYVPLVATVRNVGAVPVDGTLEIEVERWGAPGPRYRLPIDVPVRAERRVQVAVDVGRGGSIEARVVSEGRTFGRASLGLYRTQRELVVLLAESPRLRGPLLDMGGVEVATPFGSTETRDVGVGLLPLDAASGDPRAPRSARAWEGVGLLVAQAPLLERLDETEREALRDWVIAGGQLLVFPRSPGDLEGPFLRSIFGRLRRVDDYPASAHGRVPARARGRSYRGQPGPVPVYRTAFGAVAGLGFGRAVLATYDGTVEPHAFDPATVALVRDTLSGRGVGAVPPSFASDPRLGGDRNANRDLRASLDPNESFRPALALVALVLLMYVVLVGPLNFRYVARKGRPTLALMTTPVAALGCFLVLLFVGYVGKGTSLRYRSVSLREVTAGQGAGVERRFLGLYLTRPMSFDLPVPAGTGVRLLEASEAREPVRIHDGDQRVLHDLRGGLWETLFLEERRVSRDGVLRFVRRGGDDALVAVANDGDEDLLGVVVVAPGGGLYPVGDVPAGTERPLGPPAAGPPPGVMWSGAWQTDQATARQLGQLMRLPDTEAKRAFLGLFANQYANLALDVPTLYARLRPRDEPYGGRFAAEKDLRFLRVAGPPRGIPVEEPGWNVSETGLGAALLGPDRSDGSGAEDAGGTSEGAP
ncbi:MAG: hypothetical protein AAF447_19090 [Myxococcota bacterium]